MPKKRVFQLAKEMGLQSQALVAALKGLGFQNVTVASAVDEETAKALEELLAEQLAKVRTKKAEEEAKTTAPTAAVQPAAAEAPPTQEPKPEAVPKRGRRKPEETPAPEEVLAATTEEVPVHEKEAEPERVLPRRASYFDQEMLKLERQLERLAQEVGTEPGATETKPSLRELVSRPKGPRPPSAIDVPPVVTVLGHVDHGKTTLLDRIRQTNVAAQEDGGITQHIGASEVEYRGRTIVFLDTPGHEAFTQLRARGAQVTDLAVLVVAADDGIMPQTVEAINHAKAADVPILVAVNKTDLPEADPERVKQQLLQYELVPEEWGGDTIVVPVSALRGEGIDELLEMILLVAEMQELWADPKAPFSAVVIESRLDSSRGPVATVLTRSGTLKVGDVLLCGTAYGRVRQIRDWRGRQLKEVPPGRPVELVGFDTVPEAGGLVEAVKTIKEARRLAEERQEAEAEKERQQLARRRVEEAYAGLTAQSKKVLRAIIKADVWGSAEALRDALLRLAAASEELSVDIIHLGVGDVTESDVSLAVACEATIIAFRASVGTAARQMAADEGVQIRSYEIIYDALEDLRVELEGMLEPVYREERIGRAQVLQVFPARSFGAVAGCRVLDGRLQRGAEMVVRRAGQEVFRGIIDSLRRFDADVDTVEAPNECGVGSREFKAWQPDDLIEAMLRIEIRPTLRPEGADQKA
ncbi:MAG: translation initiation factor IF-2 [Armatimonadetes bacterium]|nr:translation initiation factor IF-2 [Armatimonadota bacterium]